MDQSFSKLVLINYMKINLFYLQIFYLSENNIFIEINVIHYNNTQIILPRINLDYILNLNSNSIICFSRICHLLF